MKEKKAEQRQQDDATLQRNDADAEDCERNRGQISFPSSTCIIRLAIHIQGEIAPLQNVFAHQANDRFIAMYMSLRRQQNRKARCRDKHKHSNKQRIPAHQRLVLTSPARSWHRTRRSTIDTTPFYALKGRGLSVSFSRGVEIQNRSAISPKVDP